jgi:hypothetical protein
VKRFIALTRPGAILRRMAPKRSSDGSPSEATPGAASPGDDAYGEATGAEPTGVVPKVRRAVHDLRQPVQAMRLFVHLLSTRLERAEDRALVGKLDEALENIETALRGLMTSVATPAAAPPAAGDQVVPPTGT